MRGARKDEALGIGEPGDEHLLAGVPDGRLLLALLANDGERGLDDPSRVLASERPLPYRRQLLTEERVSGRDGLGEGARERPIERDTVVGSRDTTHETIDSARLVTGAVKLHHGRHESPCRQQTLRTARLDRESRLQHSERADELRSIQRELQDDVPTGRMADEMPAPHCQLPHERADVRRLLSDADRSGDAAAAGIADPVVRQHTVPVGEWALLQEGPVPSGEDPGMHEYDRLTGPLNFVFELDATEVSPTHEACPFFSGRMTRTDDDHEHSDHGKRSYEVHVWSGRTSERQPRRLASARIPATSFTSKRSRSAAVSSATRGAGSTVSASRRNFPSRSSRVPGLSGVPRAALIRSSRTRPSLSRTVMCAAGIPSESSPSGVTRAMTLATAASARLASLNSASPASPRKRAIAAQNRTLNFASSGVFGSRWSAALSVSGITRQRTLSIASAASGVRARIARPASIVACVRWQAA